MRGLTYTPYKKDCRKEAQTAVKCIIEGEPFEFSSECLQEIVLYALYKGLQEFEGTGKVPWLDRIKTLVNILTEDEKEYIAANIWTINRKYYNYVKKELGIKVDLSKIHR